MIRGCLYSKAAATVSWACLDIDDFLLGTNGHEWTAKWFWLSSTMVDRHLAPTWWVGGAQPRKEGVRGVAPRFFLSIFWKKILVFKDRILGNTEFQKAGSYMTRRPHCSGPSCREVKFDVWKYLRTVVMDLYAVCEQKLAHPDRALGEHTQ